MTTIHRSLFDAVYEQDVDKTYALIFDGGCPDSWRDEAGNQALHAAAASGNAQLSKILINAGAKLDEPGTNGNTPLHFSTHRAHVAVVNMLLDAGADPRLANTGGKTPRDLCDSPKHTHVLQILNEWVIKRCTFLRSDAGNGVSAKPVLARQNSNASGVSSTSSVSTTSSSGDFDAALLSSIGRVASLKQTNEERHSRRVASFDQRQRGSRLSRFRSDSDTNSESSETAEGNNNNNNNNNSNNINNNNSQRNNQRDDVSKDTRSQTHAHTSKQHRHQSFQHLTVKPIPHLARRGNSEPHKFKDFLPSEGLNDKEHDRVNQLSNNRHAPPSNEQGSGTQEQQQGEYIVIDGQRVLIATDDDDEWGVKSAEELINKFKERAALRVEPSNSLYDEDDKNDNVDDKNDNVDDKNDNFNTNEERTHSGMLSSSTSSSFDSEAPLPNLDKAINGMLKSILKKQEKSTLSPSETIDSKIDALCLDTSGNLFKNNLAPKKGVLSPASRTIHNVVIQPLRSAVQRVKSSGSGFSECASEFTLANRKIKVVVTRGPQGLGMLLEEHEGQVRVCRLRGHVEVRRWRRWLATGMVEPFSPIGRVPEQHPAAAADVRVHDVIISIQGHEIGNGGVDKAMKLLKDNVSEVVLVIERVQVRMFCGDAVDWQKENVGTLREILHFVLQRANDKDVPANVTVQDLLCLHDTFERAAVFALQTIAPEHTCDVFSTNPKAVSDAHALQAAMLLQVLRDSARVANRRENEGEEVCGDGSYPTGQADKQDQQQQQPEGGEEEEEEEEEESKSTKDLLREIAEHAQSIMDRINELIDYLHNEDPHKVVEEEEEQEEVAVQGVMDWAKSLLG